MTDRKVIEKEVGQPLIFSDDGQKEISILDLEMWTNQLKRNHDGPVDVIRIKFGESPHYDDYGGSEDRYNGEVTLQPIAFRKESDDEYKMRMGKDIGLDIYFQVKIAELQAENSAMRANAMELVKENDELRYKLREGITKEGSLSKTPLLDKDTPIGSLQAELLELKQRRDQIVGYLSDIYEEEDREIYGQEWWNGN